MLPLKLTISTTNEQISVNVPTAWHDVSVLQFAQIQGEDIMSQVAVLLGLELKQVLQTDFESLDVILDAMAFLTQAIPDSDPDQFKRAMVRESWRFRLVNKIGNVLSSIGFLRSIKEKKAVFPPNIGRESIGQLELAKKFVLALEGYNIWHMAPYIYAIYMWPDRYDIEAAFASLSGFPAALVLEAQQVPITKMYNAILFFSTNCKGFETALLPCWTGNPMLKKKWPASTGSRSTVSSPPS